MVLRVVFESKNFAVLITVKQKVHYKISSVDLGCLNMSIWTQMNSESSELSPRVLTLGCYLGLKPFKTSCWTMGPFVKDS